MTSVRGIAAVLIATGAVVTARAFELYEGYYSPLGLPMPFVQWGGTASVHTITISL